jgi:DNA-binding NarL/FixJ family response regulator
VLSQGGYFRTTQYCFSATKQVLSRAILLSMYQQQTLAFRVELSRGVFLAKTSIRVLIVDDFEPWRNFVCSTLQNEPGIQIVGEVSDGSEAVQKAEELKPDLILLDIGLPTLNGVEVAKRIHQIIPDARILFLTQNADLDVLRTAMTNGAKGYILKMDAEGELIPAIAAVMKGEKFVSERLEPRNIT